MKLFLHTWAGTKSHESTQAQTQTYAVYHEMVKMRCLWVRRKDREREEKRGGGEKERGGRKRRRLGFIHKYSV